MIKARTESCARGRDAAEAAGTMGARDPGGRAGVGVNSFCTIIFKRKTRVGSGLAHTSKVNRVEF